MYTCYYPDCLKSYPTKYNLHRHINVTHLLIRKFSCEQCKSRFTCKQNLRDHELIHRGLKPFPCSVCGKHFRQISQLRAHQLIHKSKSESPSQSSSESNTWADRLLLPPLSAERQSTPLLPPLPLELPQH